jgi:regulatory protein
LRGLHTDARSFALKLLSYRSRSKKEMFEKLKRKGFSDNEIDNTIYSLEKTGLINDKTLAAELFRYSVERKSLGKKGIEAFLSRRGIDKELVNNVLSTHTNAVEAESAARFAEKKLKSLKKYPEEMVKRRLWGMLQRRGFSVEVIRKTVDSIIR